MPLFLVGNSESPAPATNVRPIFAATLAEACARYTTAEVGNDGQYTGWQVEAEEYGDEREGMPTLIHRYTVNMVRRRGEGWTLKDAELRD